MILLDTCVLIFDALSPERLSKNAVVELEKGRRSAGFLACSDISLWEIAMLLSKGRVRIPMPPEEFISDVIAANRVRILPITPKIAFYAGFHAEFIHGDPADRIIAATSLTHKVPLLTCDARLQNIRSLKTVW